MIERRRAPRRAQTFEKSIIDSTSGKHRHRLRDGRGRKGLPREAGHAGERQRERKALIRAYGAEVIYSGRGRRL